MKYFSYFLRFKWNIQCSLSLEFKFKCKINLLHFTNCPDHAANIAVLVENICPNVGPGAEPYPGLHEQ